MISDPPHRGTSGTLVYLDSNVLVAAIVRTLVVQCKKDASAARPNYTGDHQHCYVT